jgi:hypothetical protein
VFGEGLAGPVAGDQNAAAATAEVFAVVRLRAAAAGDEAGSGLVGLDAVTQPVRAERRAGQSAQLGVQPVDVRFSGRGRVLIAERIGNGLCEVLRQVPDGPIRIR